MGCVFVESLWKCVRTQRGHDREEGIFTSPMCWDSYLEFIYYSMKCISIEFRITNSFDCDFPRIFSCFVRGRFFFTRFFDLVSDFEHLIIQFLTTNSTISTGKKSSMALLKLLFLSQSGLVRVNGCRGDWRTLSESLWIIKFNRIRELDWFSRAIN